MIKILPGGILRDRMNKNRMNDAYREKQEIEHEERIL